MTRSLGSLKDVEHNMALKSRQSSKSRNAGGTLYALLAGLILGLAAAVAVALFVTQVPMPFADKASRDPAKTLLPGVRDAPDPNIGLYGKDNPTGIVASGPTATGTTPLPGTGPSVNGQTAHTSDEHQSELPSLMRISYCVFCLTKT